MSVPFWGLYDALTKGQTIATNPTKTETAPEVSNGKKRTSEIAGLPVNNNEKKKVLAPRVARMAQKGIKETSNKKLVVPKAGTLNTNNTLNDDTQNPQPTVPNSVQEFKDPYDPTKPNDYQEYCAQRVKRQQELARQRELEEAEAERLRLEAAKAEKDKYNPAKTSISPIAEKIMKNMGWKGKGHGMISAPNYTVNG
eukprot:TRINITY_DN5079_c0_g1_i1.p1 TRINITY_DN5079_c0_g1~~TRINITY_DN5079_c0_g1_i1.p1  ORF type:complete len:197 (-),score=42.33 TRINITY_DN5079_c0_g1_i1:236-826(-)